MTSHITQLSGIEFDRRYSRDIAQLFSASAAVLLARTGRIALAEELLSKAKISSSINIPTYSQTFEAAYAHLWMHYRAEYVYKNTIIRKILFGRHSPATTRVFSEFRIGETKADLLFVNGSTTVYEIKTALDSLDRLPTQLASYCAAVDRVYVVTHRNCADRVMQIAESRVGVLVLTDRGTLSELRPAHSNRNKIMPELVFDSLRRPEYVRAIRDRFGEVPIVPNTEIHRACKRLFASLSSNEAHNYFVEILRKRILSELALAAVDNVPWALKSLCLSAGLSDDEVCSFQKNLKSSVGLRVM